MSNSKPYNIVFPVWRRHWVEILVKMYFFVRVGLFAPVWFIILHFPVFSGDEFYLILNQWGKLWGKVCVLRFLCSQNFVAVTVVSVTYRKSINLRIKFYKAWKYKIKFFFRFYNRTHNRKTVYIIEVKQMKP